MSVEQGKGVGDRTPIFRTQVNHPLRGWIYVGRPSTSKEFLKGWRSFVKQAWHGLPTRIIHAASAIRSQQRQAGGE